MGQTYNVYGEIRIPVCFTAKCDSSSDAIANVRNRFNSRNILVIDGDIQLVSGSSHPLLADKCYVEWFEAIGKADI